MWSGDMSGKTKTVATGGMIEVIETGPDRTKLAHRFGEEPFLAYVKHAIAKLQRTPEDPTPGPHCQSWHGEPCQFVGTDCPAGKAVGEIAEETLGLPTKVGADETTLTAFALLSEIANNKEFELTPELTSWALTGSLQMDGFLKKVMKRLKAEIRKTGPVPVGNVKYGWFTKKKSIVDKVFALKTMLRAKVPTEDIASAISLSRTSINDMPKRLGSVRSILQRLAIREVDGNPEFGVLDSDEGEEESS